MINKYFEKKFSKKKITEALETTSFEFESLVDDDSYTYWISIIYFKACFSCFPENIKKLEGVKWEMGRLRAAEKRLPKGRGKKLLEEFYPFGIKQKLWFLVEECNNEGMIQLELEFLIDKLARQASLIDYYRKAGEEFIEDFKDIVDVVKAEDLHFVNDYIYGHYRLFDKKASRKYRMLRYLWESLVEKIECDEKEKDRGVVCINV